MIGVIANPSEHPVIREFFELFKTPWEFYRSDRQYDVLLCSGDCALPRQHSRLIVIYAGRELPADRDAGAQIKSQRSAPCILSYRGSRIPIYGSSIGFEGGAGSELIEGCSDEPAMCLDRSLGQVRARIGYDLFGEIHTLLTAGQPPANAGLPALELHIAVLRDLIAASGAPLLEIPPVPQGYRFIACLTHDVDHPCIRPHRFDHTIFGFLYRALLGSPLKWLKGRVSWRAVAANWIAALKLPLVYLGLAEDFWSTYDRYIGLEGEARSTFFVIPFKGRAGRNGRGPAPGRRASAYGAADIEDRLRSLRVAGCEIGLHGIDAWVDSSKGREELEEISRVTQKAEIGVRMHWLYFDEHSPATLEAAGAAYDSTVGYNGAVGYRAGTTQVYRPLGTTHLLELPLHVMDTALFYPSHMNLSSAEARKLVREIIDNAVRFGGCVTINWHDRSIAPERLWGDFYLDLVNELRERGAWLANAGETVQWFRERRAFAFDTPGLRSGALHGRTAIDVGGGLPGLRLQKNNAADLRPSAALGECGHLNPGTGAAALQEHASQLPPEEPRIDLA